MGEFTMNGKLCKAARALAGWNQTELAQRANVAKQTVADFERGARTPFRNNLAAIESALGAAGVVFTADAQGGVGVRMSPPAATAPAPTGGSHPRQEAERIFARYSMPEAARQDLLALIETERSRPK